MEKIRIKLIGSSWKIVEVEIIVKFNQVIRKSIIQKIKEYFSRKPISLSTLTEK